ncbi:iron ABC transporter ATP-binding protein [Basilea psittacipulmonis]|uniref:Iron ABC transporter ATP-binding protein n=1 Tax=Basilea psittacipulmonis DSM 24701 TaxID=1072685 RepID=A0A077DFP4_9BURK|nr:ATP-binding cassette domain-containing protein [Basilea psittacipulmonis]AIL32172.1 iron ABC transporter ATP-binding protein [Basilea psittacipulmonis DSM 24701]
MITTHQVNFDIAQERILKDINLDIPEKGIVAIIGPNGAGKSTLFSLIARLQGLEVGDILIDGTSIKVQKSAQIAKQLAILTQQNDLNHRITVQDLLMFGRYPHHQGRPTTQDTHVVNEMLATFELTALKDRLLSTLSGGQKQRALIAMVFCQDTHYVLLDEPLNNLDMYHARELMRTLKKLSDEKGLNTIMVVHDINIAAAWADHIIAMKDGSIAIQGNPKDVITKENLKHIFSMDTEILLYQDKPLVITHL